MRFFILLACLCAWPLFASAQVPPPDPAPSTPVETIEMAPFEPTREEAVLEAYVDGVVAAHMREHHIPGVTVSVVRNGRILFAKGYGQADEAGERPVSGQETLFRIGSVSKTFVWAAVMMLAERGQIDLDADVNQYLKDIEIPEAFGAPVTMNHLMAHRAGFEDTYAVFTVSDDSDLSLADALKAHMPKRVYPPGARTSYSNWGSALAAQIVEDVSGVSYEAFLQNEILKPLAMTHTTMKAPSRMDEVMRYDLSMGLRIDASRPVESEYMQIGAYAPVGAMASTADDMATWMLFQLGRGEHDGVRLMSPQTHALMWTRAFNDRPAGADLAHGFMTKNYRGHAVFGHGGATSAFLTNMALVPDLNAGVFVSQNARTGRELITNLPELVIDHLAGPRPPEDASNAEALAKKAEEYAGTYLENRRSFTSFEKIFATDAAATVSAGEDGSLIISSPGEAIAYMPLAGADDVYEDRYGHRIVFGRNEKGVVTHFSDASGVHSLERAGFLDNPANIGLALGAALLFAVTTWLGAWRRFGRAEVSKPIGRQLSVFSLVAAAGVFALAGAVLWIGAALATATAADMLNYPPPPVVVFRLIAWGVFAFTLAMTASLWPAWRMSGWGALRKAHYTLFTLALVALSVVLIRWNVIFSPVA